MAFRHYSSPKVSRRPSLAMLSRTLLELPLPLPTKDSGSVLARPKSQIFTLHSLSIKMLAGLISRCMTLALWTNLMARIKLYIKLLIWSSLSYFLFEKLRSCLRSVSIYSITTKTPYLLSFSYVIIKSNSLTVYLFFGI